jgi:hypothetical protein
MQQPSTITDGAQLWRSAEQLSARIRKAVRPLYRVENRTRLPQLVGASVVLRVQARFFLLTAAHVLDEFADGPISVMSPPVFAALRAVPLRNAIAEGGRADREDDALDVGVYAVHAGAEPASLHDGFLEPADLAVNDVGGDAVRYALAGYPASRADNVSSGVVSPAWYVYQMFDAEAGAYLGFETARHRHVLLNCGREQLHTPEGKVITAPSFKGMSGSGVWRFDSAANAGGRDQLAAIFTEHDDKAEIARATRVAAHVALIRAYHPELASALPSSVTWPVRVRPG